MACSHHGLDGTLDEQNTTESFVQSLDLIQRVVAPFTVRAAVLLGIPDIIAGAGPGATMSLAEVAARISGKAAETEYLSRLIRYLVIIDFLIEVAIETSDGSRDKRYGLTEMSKCFVKGNVGSLAPMLLMQTDEVFFAPWWHLHQIILEGGSAFQKAHGEGLWGYLSQRDHISKLFNEAMAVVSETQISVILGSYDGFKDIKKLVDVGGGTATCLSKIVAAYPHIQGVNYDLPHVVQSAPKISGVEHAGGDMFERIPSGDAVFMKWIMHNWDDEKCGVILQNAYKALPQNGKVIIVDEVLSSSNDKTYVNRMKSAVDMIMMALLPGGKERTREEWEKLILSAGFVHICFVNSPSPLGIIEAYKA